MEKRKGKVLKERYELVASHFEENVLEFIFDEHPYVDKVVFYGSFMKGLNHGQSDIDIICVPETSFFSELENPEDTIGLLMGLHEDFTSCLEKKIPLDVKLQTVNFEGNQLGISYHTNDLLCGNYQFGIGQIGDCVVVDKNLSMTFQSL